jgi:hypothetical protein
LRRFCEKPGPTFPHDALIDEVCHKADDVRQALQCCGFDIEPTGIGPDEGIDHRIPHRNFCNKSFTKKKVPVMQYIA